MIEELMRLGWKDFHAEGAADGFPSSFGAGKRARLFRDWCSSHGKQDPNTVEARARFYNYELRTTMSKIGQHLRDTETTAEATIVTADYKKLLRSEGA